MNAPSTHENNLAFEVRPPCSDEEFDAYYALRWEILRKPLEMARGSERDEKEADCYHVAVFMSGVIVAVGRLQTNSPKEGQIRYMAVATTHQGRGYGGLVLRALEVQAKLWGLSTIVLDARENAVEFYKKHGYQCGKSFMHAIGILHTKMQKHIEPTIQAR